MFTRMSRFRHLRAVVLDWAGTAVDFGSIAPVEAFARAFRHFGLDVEAGDIRAFMGLSKREHTRELMRLEGLTSRWIDAYGRQPREEDVDGVYAILESLLPLVAAERCDPVPGLLDLVDALRRDGVRIGSTTGYSAEVMAAVVEAAARRGYTADFVSTPRAGLTGRPAPWMMYECAKVLGVYPMTAIVKLGDTPADMEEARNAGAWAVGFAMSGNECGLDIEGFRALDPVRARGIRGAASARLMAAGAHFVVDGPWDCLPALERIEELLASASPRNP